ncbi:MAG: hypothetical protein A3B70_00755 [Deltaproteobacteria bacterium RIFCSPHIGHO2_02_FULL_40_11]|nr:MAG: hypothetical protein A3B70_00755 [Deltaproteobacteria bacterium RIFCSPHIGHO2_02_FULL_40_11]
MLRKQKHMSEAQMAKQAHVSRITLRHVEAAHPNLELQSIASVAHTLNLELNVMACPDTCTPELSTLGIGYQVIKDGFSSWKIHFFNFVDHFRKTLDPRLILLPPPHILDPKLKALLASMVQTLCQEVQMNAPTWAKKRFMLKTPWFVSESEALKASAILESPIYFRKNNIFVLKNFLERA